MSGQIILQGDLADIPEPRAPRNPRLYIATDTLEVYVEVAGEWLKTADIEPPVAPSNYSVVWNSGTDELTITRTGGSLDLTTVDPINYQGNGSGQIQQGTHFVANSPTEIVVSQASFYLNGGTLVGLDFFVGMSIADSWSGSVQLF